MELHDHLFSLARELGHSVFDDADGLRGALDDFLDEGAASTGDINLLVDAVRLGAFSSMATMLDSGADAGRAIDEAGARLARDRGSSDLAGSQWALAVLGFATGRVPVSEVRKYRSLQAPPSAPDPDATSIRQAPTMLPDTSAGNPAGNPAGTPTALPTQMGSTPQAARQASPQPPAGFGPGSAPAAMGSWPAQQPAKKKKWPIVVAVVAVLALLGSGIGVFALTRGDGGDDEPNRQANTTAPPPTVNPTTEPKPEEISYDFAAVNQRYKALARNITSGLSGGSCTPAKSGAGETEHLECTFADGTLTLVTWDTRKAMLAERQREIVYRPGGIFLKDSLGQLFSFEEAENNSAGESVVTAAYLYVDNEKGRVSARYDFSAPGKSPSAETLAAQYQSSRPAIRFPRRPSNAELVTFAQGWMNTRLCQRTKSVYVGQLEENRCDVPGPALVYIGQFKSMADLRRRRQQGLSFARDSGTQLRTWNQLEGDPPEGALFEYTTENTVVRYWDQPDCFCYAEAYWEGGTYEQLSDWWVNGG